MDQLIPQIDMQRLPRHIAIIMDGNGRWARSRGENRSQGHIAGVESVRAVIKAAAKLGIGYLTLYTFSTENWNRPAEEVDMLLSLIVSELAKETPELLANNVRLSMIGDLGRLSPQARQSMLESMDATAACTGLNLILALSYSSRWEITDTIRRMAAQVADGTLAISDIDEQCVTDHLATAGIPDPHTHRWRQTSEQLPPMADCLCRTLLHRHLLARLQRPVALRSHHTISETRAPLRPHVRSNQEYKVLIEYYA